ncbi:methyl-accepting chemotaxis protein [Asaia astilbis]
MFVQLFLIAQLLCEAGFLYGDLITSTGFYTLFVLTLLALLVSVAVRAVLVQAIAEPIEALVSSGSSPSLSDARSRLSSSDNRDESGQLTALISRLQTSGQSQNEGSAQRDALARELEALKVSSSARIKEMSTVLTAVEEALTVAGSGDLSHRIPNHLADGEYASLRDKCNGAAEFWKNVLATLAKSSEFITTGASEISMASDDLARRTEIQAENLGKAANSVRTISTGVQMTADVCSQSSVEAKKTLEQVKLATEVMDEANAAMGGIQKSSSAIGEIISVIDGITFQTNVLALNAGVEAARAGDAGRGFAVVAQEVRSLAEKSAKSANEIKRLIAVSAEQVSKGVGLVSRTSQYLGDFSESIAGIAGRIENLTATTREQALQLTEITHSINDMDQVTQQNAAMVEEATAASHNLTSETRNLSQTLGQFNVGKRQEAKPLERKAPAPSPRPVAKPVAKPVAPPRAAPPKPSAPAIKSAPKPALQVTSSDQGWEDF